MKTQDELRAEFRQLMADDRLEEAEAVLDQIEPISDEDWFKMLADAPYDDEPLTASDIAILDAAAGRREARERWYAQQTG